jgi:ubiquinol-cytochrome c reductase iron-sulfur subunit
VSDNTDPKSNTNHVLSEEEIDEQRRRFLLTATGVLGGIGATCALTPFITSWLPSAKTQATGVPVQVDLSKMELGQQITIEWQGKPVWIMRRTKEMLQHLNGHDEQLRDPNSLVEQQPPYAQNQHRSINPEYLILVGVCTHLGCSPKYTPVENEFGPNWPGGFYCPCHGSTFDLAGRVFKGAPAPINLQVPPYQFISEHVVVIGQDKREG